MDWMNRLKDAQEATKKETDPKTFEHYCEPGDCHCSGKLPGSNHPADCLMIACEYYTKEQT